MALSPAQPLPLQASFSATGMVESSFPIVIDLGDDPGQWPADPYKSFTDTCVRKCNSASCWHGQRHCRGRCDDCNMQATLAMHRAIPAPQAPPLSYTCRRCFPVQQASKTDSECCPRHSPIDMGLTDQQLLFYETHLLGAEVNPTPKATAALEHEQKGQKKAYQSQWRAAPLEVAHLEEQVRQHRSEIDSLNERIIHLLEMHKSMAHELRARAAGRPAPPTEIVMLHPCLH
jgi:hypothetical protein